MEVLAIEDGFEKAVVVPIFERFEGRRDCFRVPAELHLKWVDTGACEIVEGLLTVDQSHERFKPWPHRFGQDDKRELLAAMTDEVLRELHSHHLVPLTQWVCDGCHGLIQSGEEGTVSINRFLGGKSEWRISHGDDECAVPKDGFVGAQVYGLWNVSQTIAHLYSCFSHAPMPAGAVEVMKRLTLPYYEEARLAEPLPVVDDLPDFVPDLCRRASREHVLSQKTPGWSRLDGVEVNSRTHSKPQ